MTTAELLNQRYKIVEDYPSNPYAVGDILSESTDRNLFLKDGNTFGAEHSGITIRAINRFPNIFKKLGWWEERTPLDMPHYVKWFTNVPFNKFEVYVVLDVFVNVNNVKLRDREKIFTLTYDMLFPATKEEYDEFILRGAVLKT